MNVMARRLPIALGLAAVVLAVACHQAPTGASQRKMAEVTPEIAAKAEEILRANPNAKYDSEFPFTLAGRRYVARIEVHDNPDGDVRRPQGQHKGVTVYSAD
jgi:hypothetical protein